MPAVRSLDDIKNLGTILGVWAHPDDETFSMAGIMAAAIQNGQKVIIVTATRGEKGVQDASRWPEHRLADIRTRESDVSLGILGVSDHYWLDYPDGGCSIVDEDEATNRIADIISRHNPETILSFGPDGMTGHDDHKTASRWASLAAEKAGVPVRIYHATNTHAQYENMIEIDKKLNVYFNIDKPPVCEPVRCAIHFELTSELYDKKLAALRAMPSQTETMLKMFEDSLQLSLGTEAFVRPEQ